jgi:hypothetical protein
MRQPLRAIPLTFPLLRCYVCISPPATPSPNDPLEKAQPKTGDIYETFDLNNMWVMR